MFKKVTIQMKAITVTGPPFSLRLSYNATFHCHLSTTPGKKELKLGRSSYPCVGEIEN